jgi:hypothetical protein
MTVPQKVKNPVFRRNNGISGLPEWDETECCADFPNHFSMSNCKFGTLPAAPELMPPCVPVSALSDFMKLLSGRYAE